LIYSGVEDMAAVCQLEEKTVRKALRTLEERKVITTVCRPGLTSHRKINSVAEWRPDPTQKTTLPKKRVDPENGETPYPKNGKGPYPNFTPKGNPLKEIHEKVLHNVDFPESLKTETFKPIWSDWKGHLKARGRALSPQCAKRQLAQCERWGESHAIKVINDCIEKNYLRLIEVEATHFNNGGGKPRASFNPPKGQTVAELRANAAAQSAAKAQDAPIQS